MSPLPPPRLDRRTAIKWMLTAAAAAPLFGGPVKAAGNDESTPLPPGRGYGTDPDLLKEYHPGELWPLTFNDAQRSTAAALCSIIIPRDDRSPSAGELRVHDFIDEWISAPYPAQRADRPLILDGLAWLDEETRRRFGRDFAGATHARRESICADLAGASLASELASPAKFFARFRELTASGFYTTPEGMQDIGYVGNSPLPSFEGPPAAVRRQLGLA
jgi:hypothetical protein